MRKLVIAAAVVAAGYLGIALLAFLRQERLIFPAPTASIEPRDRAATRVALSCDGWQSLALSYPAAPGAPTVVYFHGNAQQLAEVTDFAARLHDEGLAVLAVEYPGYGMATGRPSEKAIYETAEAALGHLRALGVAPERTVLLGHSLGSGVASEMALRGRGSRLVLLSPYTSIAGVARAALGWLPVGLLVRHRFDTLGKAPRIAVPVLIVHGTADEIVPVEMARQLAGAFPSARLELIEGATHDLPTDDGARLAAEIAHFSRGPDPQIAGGEHR